MEIIIGREEGQHRLHIVSEGKELNIGTPECVPANVSRQHCQLLIDANNIITIRNLKERNVTFVDGVQIDQKRITASSQIELGASHYRINLEQILGMVRPGHAFRQSASQSHPQQSQLPTYSLLPLKEIWEEYDKKRLAIQEDAARRANQQRLQGIVSMLGMTLGFLPVAIELRAICVVAALSLAIYFFVQGQNTESVQKQIHDLDEEYSKKYVCPNPSCGKPFGVAPYHQIKFNKQCFACGCKYTH